MKYELKDELEVMGKGDTYNAVAIEVKPATNDFLSYLSIMERAFYQSSMKVAEEIKGEDKGTEKGDAEADIYSLLVLGNADIQEVLNAFKKLVFAFGSVELTNGEHKKITDYIYKNISIKDLKGLLNQYYMDFLVTTLTV